MSVPSIGIVGSESLLGRELREVLRESALAPQLQLIGADGEGASRLTQDGDEAVVITPLDERNLASADLVLLAGSAESSRKAWSLLAGRQDTPVVDLTRALEDVPGSRLVAPLAGRLAIEPGVPAYVLAHPAAIALALFLQRLGANRPLQRALVEVFEPASERGQEGVDELHQQTMKLFAFQTLPKTVFDAQLAYSLLARYGADAPHDLAGIELTVERHLATLLSDSPVPLPMPSIRLVQAPVFHGYSMSARVEFAASVLPEDLEMALHGEGIETRGAGEETPTNVGAAGERGILIGDIRADRNDSRACWFWITADNLRLAADNARQVVEVLWSAAA